MLDDFTSLDGSAPSSLTSEASVFIQAKSEQYAQRQVVRQSMDFAVSILSLVKNLKARHESVIANQIGRSGTSIGANIREAQYANGKADFIAKMQIALKSQRDRVLA